MIWGNCVALGFCGGENVCQKKYGVLADKLETVSTQDSTWNLQDLGFVKASRPGKSTMGKSTMAWDFFWEHTCLILCLESVQVKLWPFGGAVTLETEEFQFQLWCLICFTFVYFEIPAKRNTPVTCWFMFTLPDLPQFADISGINQTKTYLKGPSSCFFSIFRFFHDSNNFKTLFFW